MSKLTATQAAYIAGLIDGEGSIYIQKCIRDKGRYISYIPAVNVSNTNQAVLNWCFDATKVGIVALGGPPDKPNQKKGYAWRLRSYEMKDVLIQIQPYLIIKATQCELLLEYLDALNNTNQTNTEFDLLRRVIYSELRDLNKRGI